MLINVIAVPKMRIAGRNNHVIVQKSIDYSQSYTRSAENVIVEVI